MHKDIRVGGSTGGLIRRWLALACLCSCTAAAATEKPSGWRDPVLDLALTPAAKQVSAGREGDLDPAFSGDGLAVFATDPVPTKEDRGIAVLPRGNGEYLLVGRHADGTVVFWSFDATGTAVSGFGVGGKISFGAGFVDIAAAALDPLGRVVVAGYGRKPGAAFGDLDPLVCRFTLGPSNVFRDTSLDAGEAPADGCRLIVVDRISGGSDTVHGMALDLGTIYLVGQAQFSATDTDFLAISLRAVDGTLNTVFGGTGIRTYAFDVNSNTSGDPDAALDVVRVDGGNALVIGGFASNESGNDFAWVKVSSSTGALVTSFCADEATCPASELHGGKRVRLSANSYGDSNERIDRMAVAPDGTVVVAGLDHLQDNNGNLVDALRVMRIHPGTGANVGFADTSYLFRYIEATSLVADADGDIFVGGHSSMGPGLASNPNRVLFVRKLSSSLVPDAGFADFFGPTPWSIVSFQRAPSETYTEHAGGRLLLDDGRIYMAASRLYRFDAGANLFDYDMAVFRLKGESANAVEVFGNGFE